MEENGQPGVREYISDTSTWIRLIFMVLFVVVFVLASAIGLLVAVVQFAFKLFTGDVQPQLQGLGGSLGAYMQEIVEYEAYRREEKPYPWSPWPAIGPGPVRSRAKPAAARTARRGRGRKKADDTAESAAD